MEKFGFWVPPVRCTSMVFFPGLALLSDQTLDDQLVGARILAQKLVGGFNPSNLHLVDSYGFHVGKYTISSWWFQPI